MRMFPPNPDPDTTLVLRRVFAAPRERVFRAWIEPAALERWLRPRGIHVTVSELEARVGGTFRFDIEDGGFIAGTYLEIVPPERLVFTWSGKIALGEETVVSLDFLDQGPVTEIVLTHDGLSRPESRARAGSGWPSLLDALAKMLASPDLDS
jgi:uncharacterized protein YndB with AHSA1/START domain